jgi:acyl-CoA thioesterase I
MTDKMQTERPVVFLPLGDSYTIGTGVREEESWPRLLVEDLKRNKLECELPINPARNGFTTQDLIDKELPLLERIDPDLVTVLIGVNDWVQGTRMETFKSNFAFILDELQSKMKKGSRILVITIPDFGVTPSGKKYCSGRDISRGIAEFNAIIRSESKKKDLMVADIYELSKAMGGDATLRAEDGLHPSGKEHQLWEEQIFNVLRSGR